MPGARDLAGQNLFTRSRELDDLGAYALDGDVEAAENPRGETFLLAQKAEQDVLCPDVVVLERSRFFLRENDHLMGSLCEPLKHSHQRTRREAATTQHGRCGTIACRQQQRQRTLRRRFGLTVGQAGGPWPAPSPPVRGLLRNRAIGICLERGARSCFDEQIVPPTR